MDFLISDDAKRILGRFADREDLQAKNLAQALVTFERIWVGARAVEILEADDPSAWIAAGIAAAARLLSAVAPVIRYQRERFRGSPGAVPGTLRHDLGLQMKEDAVHRLLDVWAGGESCAWLSFQAARLLDGLAPESEANVLCVACKVWSIHYASWLMREALSLLGGIGVTEDCPGLLGQKWIDSLAETFGEDSDVAQRRLALAMRDEVFLTHFREWMREMQAIAATHPSVGAGAQAVAMEMWLWTFERLRDPNLRSQLAGALCGILASRAQILGVIELQRTIPDATFLSDLCHIQAANVTGDVARVYAGLVSGYGDDSARVGFAEMQVLLDGALAGSFAAKDRAAGALIRVRIS